MSVDQSKGVSEDEEERQRRREITSKMIDAVRTMKRIADESESPKRPAAIMISCGVVGAVMIFFYVFTLLTAFGGSELLFISVLGLFLGVIALCVAVTEEIYYRRRKRLVEKWKRTRAELEETEEELEKARWRLDHQ